MNDNDFFKHVDKASFSFTKNIFLPFIAGITGTILILYICFSVPGIREKLTIVEKVAQTSSTLSENTNYTLTSLSNYSDTAVFVAETVRPSIVRYRSRISELHLFLEEWVTKQHLAPGIVITEDGYILTNNHIINAASSSAFYQMSEANKVIVYLYNDSTQYEAKIIGTDDETDLAVIKIEKTDLCPATLGDSDSVKVGEFAMAIGNPLGMESSVTCGIISAVNRTVTESNRTYTLIQTDAAINSRQ